MNYLNSLYQQVLLSISIVLSDCEKQVKVGKSCKHIQGTNKEDKESCWKEILGKKEKKHL
jgi:hypothetical protein